MPLNPNIPLSAVQPRRNSLTDQYAQALNIKSAQQQMAAQEQALAQSEARSNALRSAYNPETGDYDWKAAEGALAGMGDIESAMGIRKQATAERTANASAQAQQLKSAMAAIDAEARLLGGVKDQAGYEAARVRGAQMGLDVSDWPETYDPQQVMMAVERGLDAKSRLQMNLQQEANADRKAYQESQLALGERRTRAAEVSANREPMVEVYDPQSPTGTSYVPRSLAAGRPGKPASGGITMTMDENGNPVVQVGGQMMPGRGGNMPLDKTNAKEAQKDIITGMGTLERLDGIAADYKADYLTYGGRLQGALGGMADKAGLASDNQKKFIQGRRAFTQKVDQEFNAYRKDITGAAAAMAELKDLKKAMINTDLSPAEFEAAYTTYRDSVARMLRLKQRILREGIPVSSREFQKRFDNAWVAGEDDSADARGMELEAQGLAENEVLRRLKAEGYRQ